MSVNFYQITSRKDEVNHADEWFVDRIMEGDPEALGGLFVRHAGVVRRLLLSIMGPRQDIDDLLQEVFLKVHRSLHTYQRTARFTTWLHSVTVNTALSALRKPRRLVLVKDEELVRTPDETADAESSALVREMLDRLYLILETMSFKRRVALTLFVMEDRPIREIAKLTGTTVPVVKSRIFFAKKELLKKASEDPCLAPLIDELRQ